VLNNLNLEALPSEIYMAIITASSPNKKGIESWKAFLGRNSSSILPVSGRHEYFNNNF
jgi:hypothetical protein